MKHNKQQSHYVLDFSDIEDISENESESSKQSNHQQQINQLTLTPNPIELLIPNLQVKKETVEIPSILIQEEEEPVIRRKQDTQKQQWQVNFDELSEQELEESDKSQVAIEIPRDPSPPTIIVEEPQYIEQYFEDQNVIEEIDMEQEQLKLEQRKEQLKQDLITKKQQQQQKIMKVRKEQERVEEIIDQSKNRNVEDKTKQKKKQKFYNPKNSLIYLRLKGREDLYKKQELIFDDQTKPIEQDEYLEGLECINSLLIGLSKIKDKKVGAADKQKPLPIQIHRHRLDEKGEHQKESQPQKKNEKEKDSDQQKKCQKGAQKEEKLTEQALKQQQLQEAQLARQIRHEKQQQEKEKQKLLEQRQVYKILTKKQINQGLILYRCQLRQKQKDSIKWLRYSEIALISKGESEIFNFEKRISDQLFMQLHKANMRSVVITKQAMFDIVTIPYVNEFKELNEIQKIDVVKQINNEIENPKQSISQDKKVKENQVIKNKDSKKKTQDNQMNGNPEKQQHLDQIEQQDTIQKQGIQEQQNFQQNELGQQQESKRTKNKVSYQESDEEKKDEDLLDADSIQIFKITQERQKRLDKKDKELKSQQNNLQFDESKLIESNELGQKPNNNNNNSEIKDHKKVKNTKIKECPLSRLETNDEIKKKQKINQKRKEKRRQEYQRYLNEIEKEHQNQLALSKQKQALKDGCNQETTKNNQVTTNNKIHKRSNKQEAENINDQIKSKNSKPPRRIVKLNVRENKSPCSKLSPMRESIEPGYVSSKRVYENRDQKQKRLRVIEDEESEFYEQNAKQKRKQIEEKG